MVGPISVRPPLLTRPRPAGDPPPGRPGVSERLSVALMRSGGRPVAPAARFPKTEVFRFRAALPRSQPKTRNGTRRLAIAPSAGKTCEIPEVFAGFSRGAARDHTRKVTG